MPGEEEDATTSPKVEAELRETFEEDQSLKNADELEDKLNSANNRESDGRGIKIVA